MKGPWHARWYLSPESTSNPHQRVTRQFRPTLKHLRQKFDMLRTASSKKTEESTLKNLRQKDDTLRTASTKKTEESTLKYLRQIDVTLRNAFPFKNTREEVGNTGVEAKQLPKTFLQSVRDWNTKRMLSMIDQEPHLLLKASTFKLAHCTVFQLAVSLNSDKMVAEMLCIAIRKFGPSSKQLDDAFNRPFTVDGFEISTWDIARLRANQEILLLLESACRGQPISSENLHYFAEFEEEKDVLERIHHTLNVEVEAVSAQVTEVGTKKTVAEVLSDNRDTIVWWGRDYGISLPKGKGNLFILHGLAAIFNDLPRHRHGSILETICKTLGRQYTTRLLKLIDQNGQTPLHILMNHSRHESMSLFMEKVKKYCDPDFDIFYVRDSAGRTILHVAAINGRYRSMETILKISGDRFKQIANICWYEERRLTALHLAVMHNNHRCVKLLVDHGCDINKVSIFRAGSTVGLLRLGALQLAAWHGHIRVLQILLQCEKLWDKGMMSNELFPTLLSGAFSDVPALHLAAQTGNPLVVKTLLDSEKLDAFTVHYEFGTALHFVAGWELMEPDIDPVCFADVHLYSEYTESKKHKASPDVNQDRRNLGGIIGCMDLLMQAGLDMEQGDRNGQSPQLVSSAPDELSRWWYDKLVRQNQEAKTNLVAASNAVSVTAALVATASFVGPLQPPLGLSTSTDAWLTGYSQVNHTAVQVFLFCNSLSFYFAIASIMLAVIPSFTIPEEGLSLEVRIANRVVQIAVVLLFSSITSVIFAFSAASIAVVPESRWDYKALAVVTVILGAFVCLIALCFFVVRLMRLIRPKARWVKILTNYAFLHSKKLSLPD